MLITKVKPEMVTECTLLLMGLPLNSPDTVVQEMVENQGGQMVSPHSTLDKVKDGPWGGQYNGSRRYRVKMGNQVLPV